MEDVLEVYHRPRDKDAVVVCIDEICKQLTSDVTPPLPTREGAPAKEDHEYVREGSASLFLAHAPLEGERHVYVSEAGTRKGVDYAEFLRQISDEWFPDSARIILVEDNLNTHTDASLYKSFAPEEAFRLARRFERHRTPVHGSWLNIAESELSVLARQCLSGRIHDVDELRNEAEAWATLRNEAAVTTSWQFTTTKARIKLTSLYPII